MGRTGTDPTHRAQKPSQLPRIGIQCRKDIFSSAFALVLQLTGAQGLRKRSPEAIEPGICHFKNAADIGWLSSIEKQVGVYGVAVDAVLALQQLERDQRIKEVTS